MRTVEQIREHAKKLIQSQKREVKKLTENRDKVASTNFPYATQLDKELQKVQMSLSGMEDMYNFVIDAE